MEGELNNSLEYTPTWVVAVVCFVIVLVSLCAERSLHQLGKCLKREDQDALFEALQKLKEELMLLGFISLLLTVTQGLISRICIPTHLASHMLPCKSPASETSSPEHYSPVQVIVNRRLLSTETHSGNCRAKGKVPLLSLEALHHLHIFIFVLAVVHVIFCATTMVLGGARIRQWKYWEDSTTRTIHGKEQSAEDQIRVHHHEFFRQRAVGFWTKAAIISWMKSFFKQFYGSVTKSDYIALRQGFIKEHCPRNPNFNFHKYMMRTLEVDFRKIVGISWYLWLFVVLFLLMNIAGWRTYFWLSFLPLVLLLLVGAKLEHIITILAQDVVEKRGENHGVEPVQVVKTRKTEGPQTVRVKPSDDHFWFGRPKIILFLIHFILFQNSFEIAFFFWIWCTYGFHSCIMEEVGFIVARLIIGVIVQVLCSYSTLPLYALVTQMGSMFKKGMFDDMVQSSIETWADEIRSKREAKSESGSSAHKLETELSQIVQISEHPIITNQGATSPASEANVSFHLPTSSS